jgi:hypothetical protein
MHGRKHRYSTANRGLRKMRDGLCYGKQFSYYWRPAIARIYRVAKQREQNYNSPTPFTHPNIENT